MFLLLGVISFGDTTLEVSTTTEVVPPTTIKEDPAVGVTPLGLSTGDNVQDELVTLNEETLSADLVSDQEKLEQERLLEEYEDKKRSSYLSQELQANYDSEFQSETTRYVSTLPIARQRELDVAVSEFNGAEWMN
jgi:hypothetical protein